MKRRELLKSLSLVAGGALCPVTDWARSALKQYQDQQDQQEAPPFALAIRGVVQKKSIPAADKGEYSGRNSK